MGRGLLLALLLMVGGCSVGNVPPVVDIYGQKSRATRVTSGEHQVRKGETLYSIAWRYGWDFRKLARANDIASPYTIYPGQMISLSAPASSSAANKPKPAPSAPDKKTSSKKKPTTTKVEPEPKPKPKPKKKTTRKNTSPSTSAKSSTAASAKTVGPVTWRWPAAGKLVERFASGNQGRKGIAIGGSRGSPVVAAAAGQVVYRGSGLTGYGKLLIIKHNERWLSAYAHNNKMLVKEGQAVKAGEKIATMGASGTFRTQLHFEIRRGGKPVDPLGYLPKR